METWAELGLIGTSCSPKLLVGSQTEVFLCTGCDEIYVFSPEERKLTASKSHCLQSGGNCSATPVLCCFPLLCLSCRLSSSFPVLSVTWFRATTNVISMLPVCAEFIASICNCCLPGMKPYEGPSDVIPRSGYMLIETCQNVSLCLCLQWAVC